MHVDDRSFDDDGDLHLIHSNLEDEMRVALRRVNVGEVVGDTVIPGDAVANFKNGSLSPTKFGILHLNIRTLDVKPGEYTGTIYFNISIINE